ncbi:hypothetical protein GCM10009808_19080 [Microbacterium sediminicola]|uniref:Alpha/beta hydrolase n=1 Tax=Microbacterium sediminicola TaxID=415210 RepID=A0ABN2IAJ6_9MICO
MSAPRVVLLDGWQHRRAPVHWQGWLAERLTEHGWEVDYLTLPDPERPRYTDWARVVERAVQRDETAPLVIAHGLSVLQWLRMCEDPALTMPLVPRALLVAPPAAGAHGGDVSEYRPSAVLAAAVERRHAVAPLLVSTVDDPYLPEGAGALVEAAGADWVELAEGAHLNTASGFGPWPAVLEWCLTATWPRSEADTADLAHTTAREEIHVNASSEDLALDAWLEEVYRPDGHRLGILSAAITTAAAGAVDDAIASEGLLPIRRHAQLTPRTGEDQLRPEDVADFVRRYGHEYQAAVIAERFAVGEGGRDIRAALDEEGVLARFI